MRILHLDAGREMRGGQWQVLRLIHGLHTAGFESTLLARPEGPLFAAARREGWRVEPLGLTRAVRLARRHDIVHAHDARTHTLGAIVRGAPLVVARRVSFPIGSRWKYGRASRYIAVSAFVKGVLMEGGVSADRISVVYDGVPLLEPARGDAVIAPANLADPRKGQLLAAEGARLANVPLELSSDLERDLRHAGTFIYITHSEGLGSGALLAMSAGIPVIASNIGGLREAIEDRVNGLLVENDAESISQAIRCLLTDPDFARSIGAAARRTIQERFTVDRMVWGTIEVYRAVLLS
jgi:glycosyltransferase involved in cell wall biosynthesis